MMISRPILSSALVVLIAGFQSPPINATDKPIFNSISKDKSVRRKVFPNGDYCLVREYASTEHWGMRVLFLAPERSLSEADARALVLALAKEYCGKQEFTQIQEALPKFKPPVGGESNHWSININAGGYSEFFVSVHWLGESVSVEIKYYR